MIKKICFFLIFMLILLNTASYAHVKPDEISLTDYSGIISESIKDYVNSKNSMLFDKTGAKIIFVTTNTTDGLSADKYTQNLYTSWNMNSHGRGNSVFVVIADNLNDYGIIQGKNIKRTLTDDILYEKVLNDFEPYFADGSYDVAVYSLYNSLAKWYEENYKDLNLGIDLNADINISGEKTADIEINPDRIWILVCIGAAGILCIVFFEIKRRVDFKSRRQERQINRKRNKADIDKIVNS